jgi:hypothetical protein
VQESIRGHRAILAALARRDATRLERTVEWQLQRGKGDYRRIFPVGGGGETVRRNSGDRGPRAARRKEGNHA